VVVLGEHLGQVLVIEASVLVFGQLDHSVSDGSFDRVVGGSAAIAVGQAGHSRLPIGPVKALELSLGDAQKLGRLGVDQRS